MSLRSYPSPFRRNRNFAMTPLLKPLLDYTASPVRWLDPEVIKRADAVAINLTMPRPPSLDSEVITNSPASPSQQTHSLQDWQVGQAASGPTPGVAGFLTTATRITRSAAARRTCRNVLTALSRFDGELPSFALPPCALSRFPCSLRRGRGCAAKHLAVLKRLTQVATLRALALLELGRSEEALQDVNWRYDSLTRSRTSRS